jgi:hypothetical protein
MPASYHISPKIACIIVRLEGIVTDGDLIEGQQHMFSDPLFKGDYARLIDATDVVMFTVSTDTVRALATAAVDRGLRKAALISNNTDFVERLMRLYEKNASPPADVAVYKNMEEALQWLAKSIGS